MRGTKVMLIGAIVALALFMGQATLAAPHSHHQAATPSAASTPAAAPESTPAIENLKVGGRSAGRLTAGWLEELEAIGAVAVIMVPFIGLAWLAGRGQRRCGGTLLGQALITPLLLLIAAGGIWSGLFPTVQDGGHALGPGECGACWPAMWNAQAGVGVVVLFAECTGLARLVFLAQAAGKLDPPRVRWSWRRYAVSVTAIHIAAAVAIAVPVALTGGRVFGALVATWPFVGLAAVLVGGLMTVAFSRADDPHGRLSWALGATP